LLSQLLPVERYDAALPRVLLVATSIDTRTPTWCNCCRYALRMIEETSNFTESSIQAWHDEAEQNEKEWEQSTLRRIKEQEERIDTTEDDDFLFYEVAD
jgi:hypothetical protein